ncbi:hypothetical protein AB3S75_042931 [Citrus x aurantiifolia]
MTERAAATWLFEQQWRKRLNPGADVSSPHFFKIIFPFVLGEKKLRIPRDFVKKFGHELSNGAQLTVPDGSVWQVALTRKGKDIWFHYGWEDFVESYSISAGYFLFFSYEKNSTFHVIIFNLDACEVDYLYVGEESMNDEQNSDPENEKSVEHVEQQSRKRKMEEVAEMDEPNSDNNFNLSVMLKKMGIYVTHRYRRFSAEESKRAISFARIVKPKNSSFMVILEQHFKSCRDVYCPIKFAEKFVKKDSKFVKVQISNEVKESIELQWKPNGGFFLTRGWARISRVKNLKEGDICIFELIRKQDLLFKLSVFHSMLE